LTQEDLGRVRKRLTLIKKGLHTVAGFSKKRLAPPFFLAPATTYLQVLKLARQAKANAARAEAEAARPGGG